MSKKKKKNAIWRYLFRIAIAFVILVVLYIAYLMIEKENGVKGIFQNIENQEASLTEYIVYGTHLNIKGTLDVDNSSLSSVSLCLRSLDEEKSKEIDMKYETTSNGIAFNTSELINEGIDLEKLEEETYYLFVKVGFKDNISKYYSIKNETKYENIEYYTITKNDKNNKIDIAFNTYNMSDKEIKYMYMNVRYDKLPDYVYDIVIDPGHGRKRCWS